MKKGILFILAVGSVFVSTLAQAYSAKELCKYPQFTCIKVRKGDTWESAGPTRPKEIW